MDTNIKKARSFAQKKIMDNAMPRINSRARVIFEEAKSKLLSDFESHPISMAIKNHSGIDGLDEGTLFGFIGFEAGSDPLQPIRNIFISKMRFIGVTKIGINKIHINFSMPTKEDIFEVTGLPWAEGRSWTEMMETGGIPGVGHYLGKFGQGVSQEGIQIKGKLRSGKFGPRKYISSFLTNAEKRIRKEINETLILT